MAQTSSSSKMPEPRDGVAEQVAELVGALPGIRQGKMYGCPAFYAGKKLFACVYGDGLAVKLPAAQVEELLGRDGYTRFEPMGRKMREWVLIILPAIADYSALGSLLAGSAEYVGSLADVG